MFAKRIWICYRDHQFPWDEFSSWIRAASVDGFSIPRTIVDLRQNRIDLPLLGLLSEFEGSETTEPHDVVYSLLPLAEPADRRKIAVDYSKSLFRLFADIVQPASSAYPLQGPRRMSRTGQSLTSSTYQQLCRAEIGESAGADKSFATKSASYDIGLLEHYKPCVGLVSTHGEEIVLRPSLISLSGDTDWFCVYPTLTELNLNVK